MSLFPGKSSVVFDARASSGFAPASRASTEEMATIAKSAWVNFMTLAKPMELTGTTRNSEIQEQKSGEHETKPSLWSKLTHLEREMSDEDEPIGRRRKVVVKLTREGETRTQCGVRRKTSKEFGSI